MVAAAAAEVAGRARPQRRNGRCGSREEMTDVQQLWNQRVRGAVGVLSLRWSLADFLFVALRLLRRFNSMVLKGGLADVGADCPCRCPQRCGRPG